MTTRVVVSARVFGLAVSLGLAGAAEALPAAGSSFLVLCAFAALACVPQTSSSVQSAVPVVEAAMVGLLLGLDPLVNQPLGLYLLLPPFVAGMAGGVPLGAASLLAEAASIGAALLVGLEPTLAPVLLADMLPWLTAAAGMGLLGAWIRRLEADVGRGDREHYIVAHQLLSRLRLVSRRLPTGLNPMLLSSSLLEDGLAVLGAVRGAVLVADDGGSLSALAIRRPEELGDVVAADPVVDECWSRGRLAHHAVGTGSTRRTDRCALPLRVGTRLIGVFVADGAPLTDTTALADVQALLDERSLALDTALLFEDVRELATVEERGRLAREIHDGVAQEIASLGYLVDELASESGEEETAARVAQVRGEISRILSDLRLSIFDLRSQVRTTAGLGSVLSDYARRVGARSGMKVHLSLDEVPLRLRPEVEEELLRITQEAVTNARKHSGAANLWVSCRVRPPAASLEVADDGAGLRDAREDSFGLEVMRERACRIGAQLRVRGRVGGGTAVTVWLSGAGPGERATSTLVGEPQGSVREFALAHNSDLEARDG